jgi:hypothetical protein
MEDVCILCNVIEIFSWRKVTKTKRGGPLGPFKLQMALAQLCKNTSICLCKHPNISIANGRNCSVGCWLRYLFSLAWAPSEVINPWVTQDWGNRTTHVGSTMTMLTRVCECHFQWAQCWLVNEKSWTRLKEVHVVVLNSCGSQLFAWWQQRCHELHHEFLCARCHEHNVKGE